MEKLKLQRVGVSESFKSRLGDKYVELSTWQQTGQYIVKVFQIDEGKETQIMGTHPKLLTFADAVKVLEDYLNVSVDGRTMAYCYATDNEKRIWPHIANDVYETCAVYEPETNTIRGAIKNYCLIRWVDGQPDFEMDGAAGPYRDICREAYAEYIKPHNQRNSDRENKCWLAWLIGEYIKTRLGEKPEYFKDMDSNIHVCDPVEYAKVCIS